MTSAERLALLGDRVLSLHMSELLLQRDATASARRRHDMQALL